MMKHCLHTTGRASSHLSGGSINKHCCNCGKTFEISFKYISKTIPGHGPYHKEEETVCDKDPNENCPNTVER